MTLLLTLLFAASPIRYLALGDSFTAGTGAEPGEDFPTLLGKRWKTTDVANVAVNGYTSQLLISRELPDVEKFAPTHVTVLIGANDIVHKAVLETYRAQIRRIIERLMKAGVEPTNICFLPQPDWPRSPVGKTYGTSEVVVAWNKAEREMAAEYGACYIDLSPLMIRQAGKAMWAKDGLHPNAAAYAEWAHFIAENNPWGLR